MKKVMSWKSNNVTYFWVISRHFMSPNFISRSWTKLFLVLFFRNYYSMYLLSSSLIIINSAIISIYMSYFALVVCQKTKWNFDKTTNVDYSY